MTSEVANELKEHGIKNTKAKSALLSYLKTFAQPIDANTLHKKVLENLSVNLVTVYRTLQQFSQKQLVQEIVNKDGVIYYEYIAKNFKSHPHFECETCKKVFCLGELNFNDAIYFSNMAKLHKINSIQISLSGICDACQQQNDRHQ